MAQHPFPKPPVFRINRKGLSALEGLRAALAISAVAALSLLLHRPDFMWGAIASFWTCLSDPGGALKTRAAAILSFVLLATFTCFIAATVQTHEPFAVLPLAAIWIFCGVMSSSFGSAWAQVGSLTIVVFIVAIGRSPTEGVLGEAGIFFAGGIWAVLLTLVFWTIQPYLPLRRAVSASYYALGALAADLYRLTRVHYYTQEPWNTHASTFRKSSRALIESARSAVVYTPRLSGQSSAEGSRLRLQVELADQVFVQLIALSHLLELYMERQSGPFPSDLARSLRRIGSAMLCLALALTDTGTRRARRLRRTSSLVTVVITANYQVETKQDPLLKSIREIIIKLSDRIKVILTMELEDVSIPQLLGSSLPPVVNVRKVHFYTTLQENLASSSTTLHHALRACVTGTIAVGIIVLFRIPFGYWLAMTTVMVLQPFVSLTWPRAAERVVGSAIGGTIAAFSGIAIHSPIEQVLLISALAFITMAVRTVNYTVFICFLTPLFVLVADLGHPGPEVLLFAKWRVFDTVLGSMLALLGGLIFWPTWEIGLFPEELAKAIETNTAYAGYVLDRHQIRSVESVRIELKSKRRAAGIASNAAEASLQRLLMEPRAGSLVDTTAAAAVLAAIRRMGGAAAALWLGEGTYRNSAANTFDEGSEWVTSSGRELARAARLKVKPNSLGEMKMSNPTAGTTDLPNRIVRQIHVIHSALEHLFSPPPASGQAE